MKEIILCNFITKYLYSVIVESDGSTSVLLTPPRTPSSPLEVETSTSSLGITKSYQPKFGFQEKTNQHCCSHGPMDKNYKPN